MKNSTPIVKDTLNIRPVLLAIISFEFDFLPIYNKKQRTKDGNIPNQRIKILKSLICSYVYISLHKKQYKQCYTRNPTNIFISTFVGFLYVSKLAFGNIFCILIVKDHVFFIFFIVIQSILNEIQIYDHLNP